MTIRTLLPLALAVSFAILPAHAREDLEFFPAASPKVPFSPAVRVGDTLYLSGAIGAKPGIGLADGVEAQARQAMENIKTAVTKYGATMDDVFKCTVMLKDFSKWDAFNAIYVSYFKPDRLPARSAFGVNGVIGELEVECMAHLPAKK
jgi:enamine deaminase RidA (YjgF/YER057c/UK114 family)